MSIAEKLTAVAENQQKVYDAGFTAGKAEGVADDISQYAAVLRFTGVAFPDGYELNVSCLSAIELPQCKGATGIKKFTLRELSLEKQYNASNFAYACESVEEIVLTDGVRINSANYMCTNAYRLRCIVGAMDMTGNTSNNMWQGCRALEEIRFVPKTIGAKLTFQNSSKLSAASIQSIIDGLADLTGQTGQTLTLHADVGGKLTDEQKAAATAKNWNLVY